MSIMDMFSGVFGGGASANQNNQQQSGAGNPGNIPPNTPSTGATPPGAAPNGTIPPTAVTTPAPEKTALDDFADIWKNEVPVEGAKPEGVFGGVDPKKFMEAAGKIDFAKVVTPEQLQKISQGGEDAQKAFALAMNSVAQHVYAQSSFASTKMIDAALAKAKEGFMADLPKHIKKQQVNDSLRQENPVFSNPAVQPIISALEAQLTVKYPNAAASEITTQAKQYIEAMGSALAPKPKESAADKKAAKEIDWSNFLEG